MCLGTAYRINASGQIVGRGNDTATDHAVLWQTATSAPIVLGDLGADAEADGLNDLGDVVGYAGDGLGNYYAVLWNAADPTTPLVLPGLGGSFSMAYGINNSRQIVGISLDAAGVAHPVLWDASEATIFSPPTGVPEPATGALALAGAASLAAGRGRRGRAA